MHNISTGAIIVECLAKILGVSDLTRICCSRVGQNGEDIVSLVENDFLIGLRTSSEVQSVNDDDLAIRKL